MADYIASRLRNIVHNTQYVLLPLYFQHAFDRLAQYQIDDAIRTLDAWLARPTWTPAMPPSSTLELARANLEAFRVVLPHHVQPTISLDIKINRRTP